MNLFKNGVGRPSNETKRKRKLVIGIFVIIFILVFVSTYALTNISINNLTGNSMLADTNILSSKGLSGCEKNGGVTPPTTTKSNKPSKLDEEKDYYVVKTLSNIEDIKKQADYSCDASNECYANAYYMKLIGKTPIKYYGHCDLDQRSTLKTTCTMGEWYTCNSLCPDPKTENEGDLVGAYANLILKGRPSILILENGDYEKSVVIIGIKKTAYNPYDEEMFEMGRNMDLSDFYVVDPYNGNKRTIIPKSEDNKGSGLFIFEGGEGYKYGWKVKTVKF